MKFLVAVVFALFASLFLLTFQAGASGREVERTPTAANETMLFAGVFTNTVFGVSGLITIDLTINADNTLEGNVDFSQFTGGQFSCGSGDFTGTKEEETIELIFTSDDVSPACGFFKGVTFTIEAALMNNTFIRGEYSTDTGDKGVVDLRRISALVGVYLPLIRP